METNTKKTATSYNNLGQYEKAMEIILQQHHDLPNEFNIG